MAYKLILPSYALIHPVFHVSVLKPFKGDASQPYMPFLLLTNEKGPLLQPIRWSATWEDVLVIQQHCGNFNLEDKVIFSGGRILRESSTKTADRSEGLISKRQQPELVGEECYTRVREDSQ